MLFAGTVAWACGHSEKEDGSSSDPDAGSAGAPARGGNGATSAAGPGGRGDGGGASTPTGGTGADSGHGGAEDGGEAGTTGGNAGSGVSGTAGSATSGFGGVGFGGAGFGGNSFSGAGGRGGAAGCPASGGFAGSGSSGGAASAGAPALLAERTRSTECTTETATPVPPATLDVTLTCAHGGLPLTVSAPRVDARAYVAFTPSGRATQFATLDATSVSVNDGPAGIRAARVTDELDAQSPSRQYLVGNGERDIYVYRVDEQSFVGERADLGTPAAGYSLVSDVRLMRGTLSFVYAGPQNCSSSLQYRVARRSSTGQWTSVELPFRGLLDFVLDFEARPHVVALNDNHELVEWASGLQTTLVTTISNITGLLSAAMTARNFVTAAVGAHEGIHLVTPDNDSPGVTWRRRVLADTQHFQYSGCPALPALSEHEVSPTPCTNAGSGVTALSVTWSANGGTFVAYVLRHMDRDDVQSCTRNAGGLITCQQTPVTDRSTAEIVVVRAPEYATTTPEVVYRTPISWTADDVVEVDARGNHVALVTSWHTPTTSKIRHVMLTLSP